MTIVLALETSIIHLNSGEVFGGLPILNTSDVITLNRASLNEQGIVQYLMKDSVCIPSHSIAYVEKMYPIPNKPTALGNTTENWVTSDTDSDSVKAWFVARGILTPSQHPAISQSYR